MMTKKMKNALLTIVGFGVVGAVCATAQAIGEERRMSKVLDVEDQFKDQSYGSASWKPLTDENKIELTKTARLVGRNVDDVAGVVNNILKDEQNSGIPGVRNAFACAEHGRLDPEIAVELARTSLLLDGQMVDGKVVSVKPEELANDFRSFCGQGEVVKLKWLTDQDCAEMIKTSRLSKKHDFGTVLNAVKDMAGFESFRGVKWLRGKGFKWGVEGKVAVELVKASYTFNTPPEAVAKMFATVYSFGEDIDNSVAVEIVKASLVAGTTDVKAATESYYELAGFFNLNRSWRQVLSTTPESIAEMVKLAAAAKVPVKEVYDQARKVYGWGVYNALYGVTRDNAMEIVKLAYLDKANVKKLMKIDHKYRGERVDRGSCDAVRAQVEAEPVKAETGSATSSRPVQ